MIDAALKNDHQVTIFNRGKNYVKDEIENVKQNHGERNSEVKITSRRGAKCRFICLNLTKNYETFRR